MPPQCRVFLPSKPTEQSAGPSVIEAVKAIADACKREIGFVRRAALEKALGEGRLLVATSGERESLTGFAHFRCTCRGHVSLYEIAVHPDWRGEGVGRALVAAVIEVAQEHKMKSIRLKCPIELFANGFYWRLGFTRRAVEHGKVRPLAVWEKHLPLENKRQSRPTFFLTLTNHADAIRKVMRLWDEGGDPRDPFGQVVFTPLFSSGATTRLIRSLVAERGSEVMFDSGGYQVQMGKVRYEELFERLLKFYRDNGWGDWYVLPDQVPYSADSDLEVEFKVREMLDFARLFVRKMPNDLVERAVGVVHGRTPDQVRRCIETYSDLGLRYVGFGSFGTSGSNGSVNMISHGTLHLLGKTQDLADEYRLRLHVFGIGSPNYLARIIKAGIALDSFDSAGWWKAAGFGKVFFPGGSQLHVTRLGHHGATEQGIEQEKWRRQHHCPFCADVSRLRQSRMARVMHNLAAMMDTVQRIDRYDP